MTATTTAPRLSWTRQFAGSYVARIRDFDLFVHRASFTDLSLGWEVTVRPLTIVAGTPTSVGEPVVARIYAPKLADGKAYAERFQTAAGAWAPDRLRNAVAAVDQEHADRIRAEYDRMMATARRGSLYSIGGAR